MENKGIFSLQDKIQSHLNQWKKLSFSTDKVRPLRFDGILLYLLLSRILKPVDQ